MQRCWKMKSSERRSDEAYTVLILFLSAVPVLVSGILSVPCPSDGDTVCIKCVCDESKGFSTCEPMKACPYPITKKSNIIRKTGTEKCPFTKKFTAECVSCECSGSGQDNCGLCFALPAKRKGQPDSVNQELPQPIENRLIQYEINGWSASENLDE